MRYLRNVFEWIIKMLQEKPKTRNSLAIAVYWLSIFQYSIVSLLFKDISILDMVFLLMYWLFPDIATIRVICAITIRRIKKNDVIQSIGRIQYIGNYLF